MEMRDLKQKARLMVSVGFFFAVIACVSPRDDCEEYNSLDSALQRCVLGVGLLADCREQLALGAMSEEDCKKIELLWMDGCYSYATDSERCSKEVDLPVIPKIVNRQMKPDAADFIRWRMARRQRGGIERLIRLHSAPRNARLSLFDQSGHLIDGMPCLVKHRHGRPDMKHLRILEVANRMCLPSQSIAQFNDVGIQNVVRSGEKRDRSHSV